MAPVDFKEKLREQLRFLSASSEAFDRGDRHEAQRIATAIRVLMHDHGRSVSLLTHLNAWDFSIPTTTFEFKDPSIVAYGSGLTEIHLRLFANEDGSQGYEAAINPRGAEKIEGEMPASEWWNQAIYLFVGGEKYRRRDLALTAANNDGGAHVDANLPPIYAYLSADLLSATYSEGDRDANGMYERDFHVTYQMSLQKSEVKEGSKEVKNIQYCDLRQMACELLSSDELRALAEL
jgi:hypothetical protein